MLNSIPVLGWLLDLLIKMSLALPFWLERGGDRGDVLRLPAAAVPLDPALIDWAGVVDHFKAPGAMKAGGCLGQFPSSECREQGGAPDLDSELTLASLGLARLELTDDEAKGLVKSLHAMAERVQAQRKGS